MSLSSLGIGGATAATPVSALDPLRQALSVDDGAAAAPIAPVTEPIGLAPRGVSPPAAALAAAVQDAAGRQGGLTALIADLGAALQSSALPAPVTAAANQLLGLQLPLEPPPTAADLRQALAQSGIFLESQLATAGQAADGDMKSALLNLEQALQTWTGGAASRMAAEAVLPPPYRGGPLLGQPPAQATLPPDATLAMIGAHLMQATTRAIARTVLLQAASLPRNAKAAPGDKGPRWRFDVPLNTAGGGAVAQFEISRDDSRSGGQDPDPAWEASFSLHLEPMGPVQAKVALSGDRARVTLWAERAETADKLSAQSADLVRALGVEQLVGSVTVIAAAPVVPAPAPGLLVDNAL